MQVHLKIPPPGASQRDRAFALAHIEKQTGKGSREFTKAAAAMSRIEAENNTSNRHGRQVVTTTVNV